MVQDHDIKACHIYLQMCFCDAAYFAFQI